MNWLDSLLETGGELISSVYEEGGSWIEGAVDKFTSSDPDEARKKQVDGQTADGRPINQGLFGVGGSPYLMIVGVIVVLLLAFLLIKGGK